MPVTKSAKKKLRQDKKRQLENNKYRYALKSLIKKASKNATEKTVIDAIKTADKAVKKHIIAKNKAARIKSKLSKLINKKVAKNKVNKSEAKTKISPKKSSIKTAKK